ncbi:MAG: putative circadian clock protein KaiC [Pedosphaera sp.]|nr:putative circadian clock protein KaiC [Pedosphaera sp.]
MLHTKKRGGLMKLATGISGFDDITGGGLPQGRTSLVMGGPGTGKTVFAMQSLVTGVQRGEPGILVTFQESPRQLVEDAATFGWNLAELEKDKLVILDARIRPNVFKSIELYLTGMLAGIKVVAGEMGAQRIVFDSLDALLSLLGDRTTERHEMFRLRDWLLESGLTAVITAQVEGDDPFISQRHGFMQFMADCVISLTHQVGNPTASRTVRVLKYRGSGFAEEEFPFVIGPQGMEISGSPKAEAARHMLGDRAAGLQKEIKQARGEFQSRIESLNRQLEIKQAELDFLVQAESKRKNGSAGQRQQSVGKTTRRAGARSKARNVSARKSVLVHKQG